MTERAWTWMKDHRSPLLWSAAGLWLGSQAYQAFWGSC